MDNEAIIADLNLRYAGKLARLRRDEWGDIQRPRILQRFTEAKITFAGNHRLKFHFSDSRFGENYIGQGWTLELYDGTVLSWPR